MLLPKIYTFYNKEEGNFKGTVKDLINAFPQLALKISGVYALINEKIESYRNFTLTPNASIRKEKHYKDTSSSLKWYSARGDFFYGTTAELCAAFPEDKIDILTLSKIIKGLIRNHRGWGLSLEDIARTKIATWVHMETNQRIKASITEMIQLYPELKASNLSMVRQGKHISHKGWTVQQGRKKL